MMIENGDRIEIYPLNNPVYASENQEFRDMLKQFAQDMNVKTITYESLHNYVCAAVQAVFQQEQNGVKPDLITQRLLLGFINGKLCGFTFYYMLPNRMPHIQTIDWAYIYSSDMRISYRFAKELQRCKKLWKAKYVSLIAANPQLAAVSKRLFRRAKEGGTWIVAEDIRERLLSIKEPLPEKSDVLDKAQE